MFELHIPQVAKEEIIERYSRIKPVAERDGNLYWFREYSAEELFDMSYFWERNKTEELVKKGEITPLRHYDFKCIHQYGHHGLFKPTIAEVLAQIPPEWLDIAVAFEIIESPETADDFYKDELAANAFASGFHVSTVRLYY